MKRLPTCKIDRVLTPDGFVVLRVSGRIDQTHVEDFFVTALGGAWRRDYARSRAHGAHMESVNVR